MLVVEVLSPEDMTFDKLDFYTAHGVRELLVVDWQERSVRCFALQEGQVERDRSRQRPQQLERSGWRYYPLWTIDVFADPAGCAEAVASFLGLPAAGDGPGDVLTEDGLHPRGVARAIPAAVPEAAPVSAAVGGPDGSSGPDGRASTQAVTLNAGVSDPAGEQDEDTHSGPDGQEADSPTPPDGEARRG